MAIHDGQIMLVRVRRLTVTGIMDSRIFRCHAEGKTWNSRAPRSHRIQAANSPVRTGTGTGMSSSLTGSKHSTGIFLGVRFIPAPGKADVSGRVNH
jgi:hypothetical protein